VELPEKGVQVVWLNPSGEEVIYFPILAGALGADLKNENKLEALTLYFKDKINFSDIWKNPPISQRFKTKVQEEFSNALHMGICVIANLVSKVIP
jgi:hypothetical protein